MSRAGAGRSASEEALQRRRAFRPCALTGSAKRRRGEVSHSPPSANDALRLARGNLHSSPLLRSALLEKQMETQSDLSSDAECTNVVLLETCVGPTRREVTNREARGELDTG